MLVWTAPAEGQNVAIPSMVDDATPGATPPPAVTLDGTIDPPPQTWDPYADPTTQQPPTLFAPGNYVTVPPTAAEPAPAHRFLQQLRFEHSWLNRSGIHGLGVNDLEFTGTFAIPFFYNRSPLLVTPGFAVHFFDGPDTTKFTNIVPPLRPDLPGAVYDAYLDFGWKPQITSWLSADLGARVGVYSDFDKVSDKSIRTLFRGLGVFSLSSNFEVAAGIVYLDRLKLNLLPAGGVVWRPHEGARYELVFPNPKIAHRLTTVGNTEFWWYFFGDFGGGSWTVQRTSGANDVVDYWDLRAGGGIEWIQFQGLSGSFEVAYVFDREIRYRSVTPSVTPDDTFMLRTVFAY